MISPTNFLSLLLHADGQTGLQNDQRFLLRISLTHEPAYFLANDGSEIYNGRMKRFPAPSSKPIAGRSGAPSRPAGSGKLSTRGTTGKISGPKQNNQFTTTSVHRPHSNHRSNGPYGLNSVENDFASESKKYKIMTSEEDILFEQVRGNHWLEFLIG